MHVEDHGEALIENHLYGGIEIGEIVRGNAVGLIAMEHWLWIDAEPNVIKVHRLDQSNVVRGVPRFKVFFGVALGIVDLREPFAEIDSVAKMSRAAMGE